MEAVEQYPKVDYDTRTIYVLPTMTNLQWIQLFNQLHTEKGLLSYVGEDRWRVVCINN
jgi:hypothetical protein